MAIYHFDAQIISRSQGRSAVACAAYRTSDKLYDKYYDKLHDYSRKADVAHSEILLPENAPTWMGNREKLWNVVETGERRKDAQLAREIQLSLPRELTLEQNIALVKEFVQQEYVSKGMVADIGIHIDKATDNEPQPHAHVMLTLREIKQEGFGKKVRDWNRIDQLLQWREEWANIANRHLALHGHDLRIDHRSYLEQNISLEPQNKIGATVVQERKARFADHQRIARDNGEKILANPHIALDTITRQQSTFTHQDLARFINRHTENAEQFQQVYEAVKSHEGIIYLGVDDKNRQRFTTQAMLTLEKNMLARAEQLSQRSAHAVGDDAKALAVAARQLTGEQKLAFDHITQPVDLHCVVGYAGTGKSYLLGAAREAWEAQGYQVLGATLSGIAAENLEASSGIDSRTLASRMWYWDRGEQLLTNQDILVVDEAGMLGSRQMARVVEEVEKHGAKIVLIGDPEQLQAIEAGAAFRAISERVGYVELTEIRRQREDWQKQATVEFATGRTEQAIQRYQQHDHVHVFETQTHAKQGLIALWNDARINAPDKTQIMLTYTREDVRELNTMARELRQQQQELGENHILQTERGKREFAENDRIYFLKNDQSLGVKNGTLGTVGRIQGNELTVRLDTDERQPERDERIIVVNMERYNHLDHGYAATFHKAQSVTVDRSYLLASSHLDRHATYVGASRHRESCDIFYSKETFANERDLAQTVSRERAKDTSLDYNDPTRAFAGQYGLAREQETNQHSYDYQQARERFTQDVEYKQRVLDRVEARREAKALQIEVNRLEREYHKPISRQLEQGEQGVYRETIEAGKSRYAVIEKDNELKLVPYEKGMERYEERAVRLNLTYDEKQGRERANLEASRERSRGGKDRGEDFELSL